MSNDSEQPPGFGDENDGTRLGILTKRLDGVLRCFVREFGITIGATIGAIEYWKIRLVLEANGLLGDDEDEDDGENEEEEADSDGDDA